MRLVTVNTWGMRGDWPQRSRMFRDGFRRLDRDQQQNREPGRDGVPAGQGITTASRWPIGRTFEVDLHLTERTGGFACTCLLTEALAPEPYGRIWIANHFRTTNSTTNESAACKRSPRHAHLSRY